MIKDTPLVVGDYEFNSRLLVGTGKYKDLNETQQAIEMSGAEVVKMNPIYWMLSHLINTLFCPTQRAVLQQKTLYELAS